MHYKIAQLMLSPRQKNNYLAEVFVAHPVSHQEALVGKLFAVLEMESNRPEFLKIINFLIDELEKNYYQNEKIILREKISSVKIEHIFESAIAKSNKNLAEFIKNEKIKINPQKINATVGVVHEDCLHFTGLGKNKAFLIYKDKETDNNEGTYKIHNIGRQLTEMNAKKAPAENKLFSEVISGKIPANGYFLFANEALPEYISTKELLEIITKLPPISAIEHIKNKLSHINAYIPFLGLIIKNSAGEKINEDTAPVLAASADNDSEKNNDLYSTEETTEKLLAPSGIFNFRKFFAFGQIFNRPGKNIKTNASSVKDKIFFKRQPRFLSFKKIFASIKNLFIYIVNLLFFLVKLLTSKKQLLDTGKTIKHGAKFRFRGWSLWLKNLSKRQKLLIGVVSISLILLILNLSFLSFKKHQETIQENYQGLVQTIEQKQNQIEASLLYNNDKGAKEIMQEVESLLSQLPQESVEQQADYNRLRQSYNDSLAKIRRAIKVVGEEIINFSQLDSGVNARTISWISSINKIYAAGTSGQAVYLLDLNDNTATMIKDTGNEALLYPSPEDDSGNIYYLANDSLLEINTKDNTFRSPSISLNSAASVADMKNFNNRIYVLDKDKGQIYRHNRQGENFSSGTAWLNNQADFSKAVSMDIDGYVYVLEENGQLLKFLKGEAEDFSLEGVEPALTSAQKVSISPELDYIYILDKTNKRLIVFNKEGKFLIQYDGSQFNDLKDFAVDDEAKKIYFLDGQSVFLWDKGEHWQ